ncbi:MAG: murein hydrolase activator EnvC family protein [Alphaproteobacteria bacterium]
MRRAVALAALLLATASISPASATIEPPPARSDVVGDRLQEIERALAESRKRDASLQEQAGALAEEVAEMRAELIRAARTAQSHEQALAEIAQTLTALNAEEREKSEALVGKREKLGELLAALERLARLPPEAMIALPAAPTDTLRSAILLRNAVPELEKQAEALRGEIRQLADLRQEINARRRAQEAQAKALGEERARLGQLLAKKATLESQTRAERERAAASAKKLASEAGDLRDLLARIEAERKARIEAERKAAEERARAEAVARAKAEALAKAQAEARAKAQAEAAARAREQGQPPPAPPPEPAPPAAVAAKPPSTSRPSTSGEVAALSTMRPPRPFAQSQGSLAFPAQGRVVIGFGERDGAGETRGVTIQTGSGAQVIAPYDGQVVFAGPFRDYGLLLIIEHGGGYHSLLAGLERIDSAVNQTLLAGEPVGVMGRPTDGNPRLYLELRQNNRPINPLPWLAAPTRTLTGKVSG